MGCFLQSRDGGTFRRRLLLLLLLRFLFVLTVMMVSDSFSSSLGALWPCISSESFVERRMYQGPGELFKRGPYPPPYYRHLRKRSQL